jgi:hypothetical protein
MHGLHDLHELHGFPISRLRPACDIVTLEATYMSCSTPARRIGEALEGATRVPPDAIGGPPASDHAILTGTSVRGKARQRLFDTPRQCPICHTARRGMECPCCQGWGVIQWRGAPLPLGKFQVRMGRDAAARDGGRCYLWATQHFRQLTEDPQVRDAIKREVQRDLRQALLGRAPDVLAELGRTDLIRAPAEQYSDLAAASRHSQTGLSKED